MLDNNIDASNPNVIRGNSERRERNQKLMKVTEKHQKVVRAMDKTIGNQQAKLEKLQQSNASQANLLAKKDKKISENTSEITRQKARINEQGKKIKGQNKLLKAISLLGAGFTAATVVNSIVPEDKATQFLPDLTPNAPEVQVTVQPIHVLAIQEQGLTKTDLLEIRDTLFDTVTVKEGQGYSQILEEKLSKEISRLGLKPDSPQLKGVYRMMDVYTKGLETNASSAASTDINHIDKGLPEGSKVYVPKNGIALEILLDKLNTINESSK